MYHEKNNCCINQIKLIFLSLLQSACRPFLNMVSFESEDLSTSTSGNDTANLVHQLFSYNYCYVKV